MRDFPPKDDNGEAIYGHVVTRTTRTLAVRYIYTLVNIYFFPTKLSGS